MDRKDWLELSVKFVALNHLVQHLYMLNYATSGLSHSQIHDALNRIRAQGMNEPWPTNDPAQSALVSGEFEDAMRTFADSVEGMLREKGFLPKA